jgi:hypothetical protein
LAPKVFLSTFSNPRAINGIAFPSQDESILLVPAVLWQAPAAQSAWAESRQASLCAAAKTSLALEEKQLSKRAKLRDAGLTYASVGAGP